MHPIPLFAACIVGLLIGLMIGANSPNFTLGKQAKELIEECESTIPRNTFCTLEAVKPED